MKNFQKLFDYWSINWFYEPNVKIILNYGKNIALFCIKLMIFCSGIEVLSRDDAILWELVED